jgi:hypothetical protein
VIDEDGASRDSGEGAYGPEQDRAQIVVVAAASEDEAGAGGGLRRISRAAAMLCDERCARSRFSSRP